MGIKIAGRPGWRREHPQHRNCFVHRCAKRYADGVADADTRPDSRRGTSAADVVDAAPGNGVCATDVGDCTLRAAIMEANALPGAATIGFDPSVFNVSRIRRAPARSDHAFYRRRSWYRGERLLQRPRPGR